MKCPNCGRVKPDDGFKACVRCRELQKAWRDKRAQRKVSKEKPMKKIDDTLKALDKYNKEHGTRLSYGNYTAMVRAGRIHSER